jgi:hypothetical protein
MSFMLLVRPTTPQAVALYELEGVAVYAQARQLFGGGWEVVRGEACTSWRGSSGR